LITNHAVIWTFLGSFALDSQKKLQILKETHLLRVILIIVLNVFLMSLQVLDNAILLLQLGIEEVSVTLEFIGQSLLWLIDELGFIANSLQECVINLSLDIVLMVFLLVISVVSEGRFHFFIHLFLFGI
jgi:hypothetical protein